MHGTNLHFFVTIIEHDNLVGTSTRRHPNDNVPLGRDDCFQIFNVPTALGLAEQLDDVFRAAFPQSVGREDIARTGIYPGGT